MATATNKEDKKRFQVVKHYHYAEIYYVDAIDQDDAIEQIEIEGLECDEIYKDFDFYDYMEVKI